MAIYEFSATVLGVRTQNVAEKSVCVKPYIEGRDHASGTVSTIAGDIRVEWKKADGVFEITVSGAQGKEKTVYMPNGDIHSFSDTQKTFCCNL